MKDTKLRTLVKTLSYRTVVAISVFIASLLMDYGAGFGLAFVVLSFTVGFASFWIQDRLWNMVDWGVGLRGDSHMRTLLKTVTWRVWSMVVLFVVGLALGLSADHAVAWTIVTNILFVVVHYVHERVWNAIRWQRIVD